MMNTTYWIAGRRGAVRVWHGGHHLLVLEPYSRGLPAFETGETVDLLDEYGNVTYTVDIVGVPDDHGRVQAQAVMP